MRKNYHNITLNDDVELFVQKYMKEHNLGMSKSINYLIDKGMQNIVDSNDIASLQNGMEKILSRLSYLKYLMEQLYSDFNVDEPSNLKESKGLKIVQERVRSSFDE